MPRRPDPNAPPRAKLPTIGVGFAKYAAGKPSASTAQDLRNIGLRAGSTRRNAKLGITLPPTPWDKLQDPTE